MPVNGHILIIDDEAALRQTLTRILQRAGLQVTSAASGQEGLDYLTKLPFDLVYLDIRMPDMVRCPPELVCSSRSRPVAAGSAYRGAGYQLVEHVLICPAPDDLPMRSGRLVPSRIHNLSVSQQSPIGINDAT
jgi:CheY-like chemotaxis protein